MKPMRIGVYLCVAIVDLGLTGAVVHGAVGPHLAIGGHIACVAALFVLQAHMLQRRLTAQNYLEWLLVGLGGPLGAAAASAFSLALKSDTHPANPELLEWYNTLSGRGSVFESTERTEHNVEYGAVLNPEAPTLKDIMSSGSLAAKRSAIAYLTSSYHRDYYAILRQALTDPEPTIRVQAAAVLTGLGQEARDDLDELMKRADKASLDEVTPLAAAITKHITSHLLDAEGTRHAVVAMAKLAYLVIQKGDDGHRADMLVQLVWGCHAAEGQDTVILRAMLNKLVATPLPEPAR